MDNKEETHLKEDKEDNKEDKDHQIFQKNLQLKTFLTMSNNQWEFQTLHK